VIHFHRNPNARKTDIIGKVVGEFTVICNVAHPYSKVRCNKAGHEMLRETNHMRRVFLGKEKHVPRCPECRRLAAGERSLGRSAAE
jgi:rRNA processing protein Gar1